MAMRQLTKRFTSFVIAQYERKTGKGIIDLISMGDGEDGQAAFKVGDIMNLIKLGNGKTCTDEEAGELLDNYLASDEDHSVISAYFDVIDELDRDLKILKECGVSMKELRDNLKNDMKAKADKVKENAIKAAEVPAEALDTVAEVYPEPVREEPVEVEPMI